MQSSGSGVPSSASAKPPGLPPMAMAPGGGPMGEDFWQYCELNAHTPTQPALCVEKRDNHFYFGILLVHVFLFSRFFLFCHDQNWWVLWSHSKYSESLFFEKKSGKQNDTIWKDSTF
jgi:hypothetical protein